MNKGRIIFALFIFLILKNSISLSEPQQDLAKGIKFFIAGISTMITGFFASKEGDPTLTKELSKIATIIGVCAIYDIYRGRSLVGLIKDTVLIALAYKVLNNDQVDKMIERLAKKKKVLKSFALEDKKKTFQLPRVARLIIAYKLMQEMGLINSSLHENVATKVAASEPVAQIIA